MSTIPYKRIIFLIIALILLALIKPVKAEAPMPVKPLTLEEKIVKAATYYATPAESLIRVAKCESSMNPKALNPKDSDGLPAYGLFQFKKTTFDTYAKKAGIENPDIWNEDHQTQVAAFMFSTGQKKQWGCK